MRCFAGSRREGLIIEPDTRDEHVCAAARASSAGSAGGCTHNQEKFWSCHGTIMRPDAEGPCHGEQVVQHEKSRLPEFAREDSSSTSEVVYSRELDRDLC